MKFVIVSDMHVKSASQFASANFFTLASHIKEEICPAFAVNLGDAISNSSPGVDAQKLREAIDYLDRLHCPVYSLAGNHEQVFLADEVLQVILGRSQLYYSFDSPGYHCIVLYVRDDGQLPPVIPLEQINWLKQNLINTDKPVLVFSHHSLADPDLNDNYWFDGKPDKALVSNRTEVRKELEKSDKVAAVFNGHLHWNKMDVHNRIPYFSIQSLAFSSKNEQLAKPAFAVAEILGRSITVNIVSTEKQTYSYHP